MRQSSVQGAINKYYKLPNNNLALELIFNLFLGIRQGLNSLVFHKQTQLIVMKPLLRRKSFHFYFILAYLIMAIAVSLVLCLRLRLPVTTCNLIFPVPIHF